MNTEQIVVLAVSIVALMLTEVLTYRSNLEKDKKTVLYFLGVFMPVIGLIFYFIFYTKSKKTV